MFELHIALLSRMKEAVTAPPHNKYRSILQSLRLESCVQLLLASHNLSGMSYFGGLGRNMLCNVSLSQGSKFLRPSAACLIPCFNAGRIQERLCLNSPIRVKLRVSRTYFCSSAPGIFCFCVPKSFHAKRGNEVLSLRLPPMAVP